MFLLYHSIGDPSPICWLNSQCRVYFYRLYGVFIPFLQIALLPELNAVLDVRHTTDNCQPTTL